ncbi:diguanylate cyclase [Neiella sp. HB171785]|uniref:diguanylate cyclase n=1 Tax=Neiella litorisoli TaxID=2771431 RepID=A0A8J6R3Z7_9GAMM|nr:diguanylate cyclase [Neiella litorisoli]MBD1390970.1 diguanylate cyclase [Neiella litorisoli]
MSIKTRFLIIFTMLLVMLMVTASCIQMINYHSDRAIKAEGQRTELLKVANDLRQSSDDLTRMARSFVATGQPKFEGYFKQILDIRAGAAPRPANYNSVYWDYITALYEGYLPKHGPAISLVEQFQQLGVTDQELSILNKALARSDQLAVIETEALNAMKGRFKDHQGDYSISGPADRQFAESLLYSQQYHQAKAMIMYPIAEFYKLVDNRTAQQLDDTYAKVKRYENTAFYMIAATGLFFLYSIYHIRRKIVNPILELSRVADQIKEGNSQNRVSVQSNDEIGKLARSFNEMNDNLSGVISKLEQLSYIDPLTQLANRRIFNQTINTELRRHQRANKPLTLMLIDVDFFKKLNDTSGHLVGDQCLAEVADILSSHFSRAGDLVARYGGEEFAVVLPDTHIDFAPELAKTVCQVVESASIPHPASPISDSITISVGAVSVVPSRSISTESLIAAADQALYQAKSAGRNQAHYSAP